MKRIFILVCLTIVIGIFSNYLPCALMKVNVTSDNNTLKFYFLQEMKLIHMMKIIL